VGIENHFPTNATAARLFINVKELKTKNYNDNDEVAELRMLRLGRARLTISAHIE
jgi:hypothetical protein